MTAYELETAKKDKYVLLTEKASLWRKQTEFKDISWNQSPEEEEKYHCDNCKSTGTVSPIPWSSTYLCSNWNATQKNTV